MTSQKTTVRHTQSALVKVVFKRWWSSYSSPHSSSTELYIFLPELTLEKTEVAEGDRTALGLILTNDLSKEYYTRMCTFLLLLAVCSLSQALYAFC